MKHYVFLAGLCSVVFGSLCANEYYQDPSYPSYPGYQEGMPGYQDGNLGYQGGYQDGNYMDNQGPYYSGYPESGVYPDNGMYAGYNGYGPFNGYADGYTQGGWRIEGDYLYWNVDQDGLPLAFTLPDGFLLAPTIDLPFRFEEQEFKWSSGYRIGIGYTECSCCNWDFFLSWTHYQNRSHRNVEDALFNGLDPSLTSIVLSLGLNPLLATQLVHGRYKLEYDVVDFEFGRAYNCGCMALRPFIGVRSARIDQKHHIDIESPILGLPAFSRRKHEFNGTGPSIGVDAKWRIWNCFSLTSSLSGALVFGRHKHHVEEVTGFLPGVLGAFDEVREKKQWRLSPMVDLTLGIAWETCFCSCYNFSIGVAYEAQHWWNQFRTVPGLASPLYRTADAHDLTLHGLTVTAAVKF